MKIMRYGLLMVCVLFVSGEAFAMRMARQSPLSLRLQSSSFVKLQSPAMKTILGQEREREKKRIVQENALESALAKEKKCQNLICIFDAVGEEELMGKNLYTVHRLMDALNSQVAPIIVTANTVKTFCYWKTHLSDKTGSLDLNLVEMTNLDNNNWYCFAHKPGLMLLISKKYLKSHCTPDIVGFSAQMAYCGFDMNGLEEISDLSPATALHFIEKYEPNYADIIDNFESMFIKNTDLLPYIPQWNIYVTGHGGILRILSLKGIQPEQLIPQAKKLMLGDPQNNTQWQTMISTLKKSSKNVSLYGGPIMGGIAGLPYDGFQQLISFFEKGIKTSYLHYNTCYAGGFNQALVNKELSQIDASFIVSTQGINESPSSGERVNFTKFFVALQYFFCDPVKFIKRRIIDPLNQDPIVQIVNAIVDKASIDFGQPFVRIPKVGVFNAISVDKQVKILTNTIARAHELEDTLIDYTDSSIKTIFVYPSYVGAPLKVNSHVAFVSPAPQEIKPTETIHIFENIFYPRELSSVIANFVSFNTRYEPITFVIKKLRCFDYVNSGLGVGDNNFIDINDLIIHITSVKGDGVDYLDVTVNALFRFNDKDYLLSTTINELQNAKEPNVKKLFAQLNVPMAYVSQEELVELAAKILNTQAVESATLPHIIQLLEEKVGKTPRVEKRGELNYALLLKKIDALERAVTQESLTHNEFLVRKLEKFMNMSEQLLQEISQLTMEQLSSELIAPSLEQAEINRNYLKMRIIRVQNIINEEYKMINKGQEMIKKKPVAQLSWWNRMTNVMRSWLLGLVPQDQRPTRWYEKKR